MYGIVNKAIKELVISRFGETKWNAIIEKSNLQDDEFISTFMYDDSMTYILAGNAAEVLEIPVESVLFEFGKYWVLNTGPRNYGALLDSAGNELKEFLKNLPNFHSRVTLYYPNILPPEFKTEIVHDNEILIHYFSSRPGLTPMVHGMMYAIAERFQIQVNVEIVSDRSQGADHDTFKMIIL